MLKYIDSQQNIELFLYTLGTYQKGVMNIAVLPVLYLLAAKGRGPWQAKNHSQIHPLQVQHRLSLKLQFDLEIWNQIQLSIVSHLISRSWGWHGGLLQI